jgi:hypothetical protein
VQSGYGSTCTCSPISPRPSASRLGRNVIGARRIRLETDMCPCTKPAYRPSESLQRRVGRRATPSRCGESNMPTGLDEDRAADDRSPLRQHLEQTGVEHKGPQHDHCCSPCRPGAGRGAEATPSRALHQGILRSQIEEIMIHVAHYAGWPAGHHGLDVFEHARVGTGQGQSESDDRSRQLSDRGPDSAAAQGKAAEDE